MSHEYPGYFLVFEGPEGSGKSTMAKAMVEALILRGYDAIYTREPGGTEYAEATRNLVINEADLHPDAQLLAMFSARIDHLQKVIIPHLQSGGVVVCDRFTDSTYAYQVHSQKASKYLFNALINHLGDDGVPDLSIYLDVDHSTALSRSQTRTDNNAYDERFLDQKKEFEAIRDAYAYQAAIKKGEYVVQLDASLPKKSLVKEMKQWARLIDEHQVRKNGPVPPLALKNPFTLLTAV